MAAGLLTVAAGSTDRESLPFQLSIQREAITRTPPNYRAYVTTGSGKIAFLLPEYFVPGSNSVLGELRLNHPEGGTITMAILDSMPRDEAGLQASACKDMVQEMYPKGKITLEFTRGGAGKASQGFDLTWKAANGISQCARIVFMPSSAGVLVFKAVTIQDKFPAMQSSLNVVIGTLATSVDGRLTVIPSSDSL